MIANDCTLDSQPKSADYYQSSYVVLRKELNLKTLGLFAFTRAKLLSEISIPIFLKYLKVDQVCSFQSRLILRLQTQLYQHINSFIKQSVFVKETHISDHFYKSLYSA